MPTGGAPIAPGSFELQPYAKFTVRLLGSIESTKISTSRISRIRHRSLPVRLAPPEIQPTMIQLGNFTVEEPISTTDPPEPPFFIFTSI